MIAVRDLQIGDFINTENNGVVQITVLSWRAVGYEGGASTPEHCSYIPLTEEILVKNGFVYREEEETCATDAFHHWQLDGHSFALNSTQYFRKEKKDDMPRFDVAGIAIHYVHQLQHLLRLVGVQKEIEL